VQQGTRNPGIKRYARAVHGKGARDRPRPVIVRWVIRLGRPISHFTRLPRCVARGNARLISSRRECRAVGTRPRAFFARADRSPRARHAEIHRVYLMLLSPIAIESIMLTHRVNWKAPGASISSSWHGDAFRSSECRVHVSDLTLISVSSLRLGQIFIFT